MLETVIQYPGQRISPEIVCADGFTVSVQASWMHYCSPRPAHTHFDSPFDEDASAPPVNGVFSTVEVGFPSDRPEPWDRWASYCESPDRPTDTVYGYVPVALVRDLIASHGGEVA